MAHVKVVRRSMRPEEWTRLRFDWLERGLILDREEVTDIEIRDARQITEDTYVYDQEAYRPLKAGELYFTPDGTAFIRARAKVPERMHGEKIYLYLPTAAEMIVKINGRYVGGIDPNRERILLNPYIDSDELAIEIEAYNRSKPDDERNPLSMAKRGCRQTFEGMAIVTLRENLQSLIYDYILLMDIADCEYFNEDYRKFLHEELSKGLDCIDFDTWEGIDAAKEHVEKVIYANTDFKGTGDVALVGHSHLDIAYYWRRIHAVQKNARTILIQLRLMDQYPEFRYTHTQAYTYETLEKYYPELFDELREKVKSGQFEPVGAMYVEPDCNIPQAESLVRQFLYGQHFFRRAFGMTLDNAWLPDVFGNSWIMPQILKKAKVDYFVSNKMSTWNDTNRFPHNNFRWRGIDGSEVYACVPPTHFITWNMPSQIQENWEAYQDKEKGGQTLSMYGYGDGGSGVTEEMLEMIRRFPKVSIMPKTEVTGGADFLHRNLKDNEKLATWDGELYLEMHRGTFTTKSNIKKANRNLEFRLRETEILYSLAKLGKVTGYPQSDIRDAYKKVLLNQFHDILPGSHIHPVYEDAMRDYGLVGQMLDAMRDALPQGTHYLNTLSGARKLPVFFPGEEGNDVRHGETGSWAQIPAEGLASADCAPVPALPGWFGLMETDAGLTVTTESYVISLRPDGSFASLYDMELGREWVRPGHGFNRLHLYADNPGVYDAWDILPNYRDVEFTLVPSEPLHLVRADDSIAVLEVTFKTDKSTWTMQLRFFAGRREIEVEHIVDWHEKHRLMKVNFAPDILTREVLCDTSAGFIRRELTKNTTWQQARFEVCHHKWFDLSETGAGLGVINEGKYGLGLEGDEVSLSLLRSTIRPDIESDMGKHDFCYLIVPHAGDAVSSGLNRLALEYNVALVKTDMTFPESLRKATIESGLELQAFKLSEDGEQFVVRLSEQDGRRGKLVFPYPVKLLNLLEDVEGEASEIAFKPFEIVTVGISPEQLK
ncbi:MAG: alpha-mannosidase [Clostridia bacterium]|nr:alpha-mannosidase [Clostridia bacterium]